MTKKIAGSNFTENWLPVKSIQNGMIITYDNLKVSGVKISPRNIHRYLSSPTVNNVMIL